MAIKEPQNERLRRGTGASDVWDNGLAGQILTGEFFAEPPATTTVYIGQRAWSSVYLSSRPDAQLYLGVRTLRV